MQHFIHARIGKRAHVGEARHESLVVRGNRGDLGLLQHDLRYPHAVRGALGLPGKMMPAGVCLPGNQRGGNRGCRFGGVHPAHSTGCQRLRVTGRRA